MPKYDINSSQFEILQHDTIKYTRTGGYFVTTKKAIIYLVLTLLLSVIVGVLVYKYGPPNGEEQIVRKQDNIQDLLAKSIRNIPAQDIRLPKNMKALHYKLKIQPDINNLNFTGEVLITIQPTEKAKFIFLNVDQLRLYNISVHHVRSDRKRRNAAELSSNATQNITTSPKLSTENSTQENATLPTESITENITIGHKNQKHQILGNIHVLSRQINPRNFQYTMHLSNVLLPDQKYILGITFTGNISESLQGLHENSYIDHQGKKKYITASHFQPVFARRVFPCFDEPSMKATFEITIVHKANMKSLSNMPVKNTTNLTNGWIEDQFETTPPMPTFLVSMALLDNEYYSSITGKNNISIWAPKEHLKYASIPLEKTEKIINFYENRFNLVYPLSKLDIVTIPTLPSTATENWGLIYFKESILLNGEDEREIFSFLAKKIAQQWFGNLVSINWWNDLWLVKGFALLAADYASVEVNKWTSDFTLRIMQTMLALDDYNTTSSLQNNISNVWQIIELYDSVSHYKGSCLLRMLEHAIQETLFTNATQNFLNEWKYKSITQNDFWSSMDNLAKDKLPLGKNVSDIMNTWSSQGGYPLISVASDKKTNSIKITQSKFQASNKSDNSLWIVPLNYVIGNGDERKLWLTNRSITITNVNSSDWVLFNLKRTGYYRVNYDSENWKMLIDVLNKEHTLIPIENRGQLINDAYKLAENGLLDYGIPFNLTKYLHKEDKYIAWASALHSLDFLKNILRTTFLNGAYEEYIQNLVSPVYNKTWNGTEEQLLLQKLIIETACSVNYEPCVDWAMDLFTKWMQNNVTVPYKHRRTVFCTAIQSGGKDEWDFLWNQIKLQKSNSDIHELFMSLGCTRDTWLINKYMRTALSGAIPWQYVPYVWESLSQPTSLAFGFKYLRENWDTIYKTYKNKPIILKAVVKDFLYALSSKSDLEDLTILVSRHEKDFQQLATLIQGVVDRIKVRVEWSTKHLYQVEKILRKQ